MNSALTEAFSCKTSSTASTPSSAKETAPIWIPIVFVVLDEWACVPATLETARPVLDCRRKSRRVDSNKSGYLVIRYGRNHKFHSSSISRKRSLRTGTQQLYLRDFGA